MDEILKLFGGNQDSSQEDGQQGGHRQREPGGNLPGGGGVWEFEMPEGGMEALQQNSTSVYKVPPPASPGMPLHHDAIQAEIPEGEPQFIVPGGVPLSESGVQESTVEGYMKSLNWPFEKIDAGLWALKYEGGAKDYEMFIELGSEIVRIVMPVIERVRDACREKVWYHLLRLNYTTDQISFGINKRDEIFMVTELLVRYISYEDFKRAITYISTMVDETYPELLYLSQKPNAVSSFKQPSSES